MAEDGRHIYVNPRYAEITGYTKAELLSMTLDDVVTPDAHQIIEQRLQARLRGEPVPEQYETRILTKRGETRWVDVSAARVVIDGPSSSPRPWTSPTASAPSGTCKRARPDFAPWLRRAGPASW